MDRLVLCNLHIIKWRPGLGPSKVAMLSPSPIFFFFSFLNLFFTKSLQTSSCKLILRSEMYKI